MLLTWATSATFRYLSMRSSIDRFIFALHFRCTFNGTFIFRRLLPSASAFKFRDTLKLFCESCELRYASYSKLSLSLSRRDSSIDPKLDFSSNRQHTLGMSTADSATTLRIRRFFVALSDVHSYRLGGKKRLLRGRVHVQRRVQFLGPVTAASVIILRYLWKF